MMDWMRNWIIGVTCASILLSAMQTLMPSGGVKKAGRIAGGLLLLLAVAAPLMELDVRALALSLTEFRMEQSGSSALLELENKRLVKEIIAEQTAAYISDKARELEIECGVEVTYEFGENGTAYPVSVILVGNLSPDQREKLSEFIQINLAVSKENISCREGTKHENG